jgi:hypothetical protein
MPAGKDSAECRFKKKACFMPKTVATVSGYEVLEVLCLAAEDTSAA